MHTGNLKEFSVVSTVWGIISMKLRDFLFYGRIFVFLKTFLKYFNGYISKRKF